MWLCNKKKTDCLGALGHVAKLPLYCILTRCRHSDILKTIMVNYAGLSFLREYTHVAAHQDDHTRWEDLSRAVQLNSECDAGVKTILRSHDVTDLPQQEAFPLESICMFVDGKKMTSNTGAQIWYAVGCRSRGLFSVRQAGGSRTRWMRSIGLTCTGHCTRRCLNCFRFGCVNR